MKSKVLRHSGFWLAYLLFMGYTSGRYDMLFERAFFSEIMQLPVKMAAVYISFYCISKFKSRQNWILLSASLFTIIVMATLLNRILIGYYIGPMLFHGEYTFTYWDTYHISMMFIDIATVVGFAGLLKMIKDNFEQEQKEQQMQNQKVESELKFLKSQTNPHFLFNTLNTIYALARKKSDITADAVMQLSKLLRFMLYESAQSAISIAKESQMIKDYIDLEKLRYNDRLTIEYLETIDNTNLLIAPLLLLPLVENAFKHGASESRFVADIRIALLLQNKHLQFSVVNSKEKQENPETLGIGLQNLRRQLELLYPRQHNLVLQETQNSFSATLHLNLDNNAKI